jgi:hypothetical protein
MQSATTTIGGAVATDETDRLISSDKVVGTAVYNRLGEHLGSVYGLMIMFGNLKNWLRGCHDGVSPQHFAGVSQ